VADGASGLRVMDVSKASAPREIASYDTPGYAYSVRTAGARAYVVDGAAGLRIIDASDPSAPKEIGHYVPHKGDVRDIDVAGPYAYLAAGYTGLHVVDISDPMNPREVGNYDTPRHARTVQVSCSYAYVGDLKWLRVFDVSKPSAPREIASFKMPGNADDVWVADETAYVAAYESGLMILGLKRKENELSADLRAQ
jgi:hypothetical protein